MNKEPFSPPVSCVFFGSDKFAATILEGLLAHPELVTIVAVVCRPGKQPVIASMPSSLPVLQPTALDDAFLSHYETLQPGIAIVASYGAIIAQRILDIPSMGTWNVHPSLLPAYRGPTPVESAIRDAQSHTGVSIMLLDAKMDHGPLFAQAPYFIEPGTYAPAVRTALAHLGAQTLVATLAQHINDPITPESQDHAAATYTTKITTKNTQLDLAAAPLPQLEAFIHAYPGQAWFLLPTGRRVVVFAASLQANLSPAPRQLIATKRAITLVEHEQLLIFERVQVEGGRPMDAQQFANGYRNHLQSPECK
jgi:methionyl-tRNA formyltransferase